LTAALQPPDGSASSSVPPARGTAAPPDPTGPDDTATTVPFGWSTLTRDGKVVSRHRSNADVMLT
jgi:hypothetical protein